MVTKEKVFAVRHGIGSLERGRLHIVKLAVWPARSDIHVSLTDAVHVQVGAIPIQPSRHCIEILAL